MTVIKPDFKMATSAAHCTFASYTNHTFPLNLLDIISKIGNIEVSTYLEFALEIGQTVDYVANKIGRTTDAFTMNRGNEFIIVYNPDLSVNIPERIRFTLAHEIGHIVMEHFKDGDMILRRGGLSEEKYKILEIEAETFAQELLAPTYLIKKNWTPTYISDTFDVSPAVSKITLNKKKKYSWIKPTYSVKDLYLKKKISLGKRVFLYSNTSRENILKRTIPFVYELFKSHSYYYCPTCGNIEKTIELSINYCPICRNSKMQVFDEYNYTYFHETKERKSVSYKSLKVDEEGRLIENCPICGNDHVKDNFCSVCGVPIVNKCSGMSKTGDNWNGGYEEDQPCTGALIGSDRYCPKCGSESTFYFHGLLKDWNTEIDDPFQSPTVDINDVKLPF